MQPAAHDTLELANDEQRLVYAMGLLGDPTRYKIFKLLMRNEELCVSEIADRVSISVSAVSQHFRNFELLGIVDKQRSGQKICYRLRESDALVAHFCELSGLCNR